MEYKLDRNVHSLLDPRTKLLLLFTSSVFVIGNAGETWMYVFYWILVYLPVLLLFAEKEWKAGVVAVVIYIGSYYAQMTLQHDLTMTVYNHKDTTDNHTCEIYREDDQGFGVPDSYESNACHG